MFVLSVYSESGFGEIFSLGSAFEQRIRTFFVLEREYRLVTENCLLIPLNRMTAMAISNGDLFSNN